MIATLSGVSYRYPGANADALAESSLAVEDGTFVLVAGPSAGGKSTLLRLFNGLIPQFHGGRLRGEVRVAGMDPSRTPAREIARIAGMVFQEPEAQAVTELVEQEIAFGMEQQAVPRAEMRRRLDELLTLLGIEHLLNRRLVTLSGGERQRVAIAAALALRPQLLLLDEPTSQLDPSGAESVIAALEGLHSRGTTVLLAEHRLERLLPVVDSVVSVSGGKVMQLGPREAAAVVPGVPAVCAIARSKGWSPMPLSVGEALAAGHRLPSVTISNGGGTPGAVLLATSGLSVAYGTTVALRDASLELREGEIVALVGANGSGKSTLFRAIAGLVAPLRGEIHFGGGPAPARVQERTAFAGLVPQDPAMALYRDSVRAEIGESLGHRQRAKGPEIDEALDAWDLAALTRRDPRDLSVGQQQRVAVAAMLAHEPRVWLMDEPTRGADLAAKAWLAERLRAHAAGGGAAIVATHDIESAAAYATRVVGLDAGEVVFDLPARCAFAADGPVPTQVARLVAGAITLEDLEG